LPRCIGRRCLLRPGFWLVRHLLRLPAHRSRPGRHLAAPRHGDHRGYWWAVIDRYQARARHDPRAPRAGVRASRPTRASVDERAWTGGRGTAGRDLCGTCYHKYHMKPYLSKTWYATRTVVPSAITKHVNEKIENKESGARCTGIVMILDAAFAYARGTERMIVRYCLPCQQHARWTPEGRRGCPRTPYSLREG